MAESFAEKRRRELGLTASSSSKDPISFADKRRMDLGMKPDTRIKESTFSGMLAQGKPTVQSVASGKSKAKQFAKEVTKVATEVTKNDPKPIVKRSLPQKIASSANKKLLNTPVIGSFLRPAEHAGAVALKGVGVAYDKATTYTGLKSLSAAAKNIIAGEYTTPEYDDKGYVAETLLNPIRGAASRVKRMGEHAVEGLLHPSETNEKVNQNIDRLTEGKSPLFRQSLKLATDTGTDPLSLATVGTVGAVKSGVLSGAKALAKGSKAAVDELGSVAAGGNRLGVKAGEVTNGTSTPTRNHIVSSTQKTATAVADKAESAYIDTVDDMYRLKTADRVAATAKGRELKPTESSYDLALASRGSDQIAKQILLENFIDAAGNVTGEGLKGVMKSVGKASTRDFEDYLVNRHAITRAARGEKVYPDSMNWTPEKGQEIIAKYEEKYPQFKQATADLESFQDRLNQEWLVSTGMIDPKVVQAWKESNPTYIDMKRVFSDLEKSGGGGTRAKSGLAGQKAPVKGYNKYGSQRRIISPIESIINKVDATVKTVKRNQSMQTLVRNIQDHPDAYKGLAEIVEDFPQLENLKNIDMTTPEGLDEIISRIDESYSNAMKSTRKDLSNVVPVMVDGKPVHVRIHDKMLLDAVSSINPQVLDAITGIASRLTNIWKGVLTGVNPVFTLTRSIFRDPISAYVQSKSINNPIQFIGDLAAAAWDTTTNKPIYKEYKNIGGGYTSPNIGTPSLLNRSKRSIIPSDQKLRGAVQKFGYSLAEALDRIESVTRVAEYKRLKGSGTLDEKLKGLGEAQEVATNFKRRGAKIRSFDAWFPYLNSAIQGIDKTVRTFKDRPGAALTKAASSVTIPAVALYFINSKNQAYQDLSDTEKDRFLHIPLPDGKFFRYPIPPELAAFSNVPRRVLDQMRGQNEDAWNDFGKNVVTTMLPPGVAGAITGYSEGGGIPGAAVGVVGDTFAGPLVDVASNKTWTGAPIIPGNLEGASPQNQYNETTSGLAKKIGQLTDSSPLQSDYLIRQYGGDLGNIVTSIADKGVSQGGKGVLEGVGKRLVVDPATSNRLLDEFYTLKDRFDRMYADKKITGENPNGYDERTRLKINRVARKITEKSKEIRAINKEKLTDTEKKKKKLDLLHERNELAREATATLAK